MFKFDLPLWATIDVSTPSGVTQRMTHVGAGKFISDLPPLVLHADVPGGDLGNVSGHQIEWDSTAYGGRMAQRVLLTFDAPSAMNAVVAAADAGDSAAVDMLARIRANAAGA